MNNEDTTLDIQNLQAEIILAKPESRRNEMGFEMIDAVYDIVKNSILERNPVLSERELTAEIFNRYCAHEFSEEEVERIVQGICLGKS